jgi:hypothetical protein
MATLQIVSKMIARMSAAFPNWNVNQYTIQVYFEDLQDIPDNELEEAARACRMESGRAFAPSIGEIRGKWLEFHDGIYRTPRPELPMPEMTEEERLFFYGGKND